MGMISELINNRGTSIDIGPNVFFLERAHRGLKSSDGVGNEPILNRDSAVGIGVHGVARVRSSWHASKGVTGLRPRSLPK